MTQLEVLGQRHVLDAALAALQPLRAAEVVVRQPEDALTAEAAAKTTEQAASATALLRRVDRLLELAEPPAAEPWPDGGGRPDTDADALVAQAEAAVTGPLDRLEQLRAERDRLPRMLGSIEALVPLVPELARLSDDELASLSLATIAVVLDDPDATVVDELRGQLREALGDRHLLVTAPTGEAVGCLLVVSKREVAVVEGLLGRDRIASMSVPEAYAGRSLASAVAAMRERLAGLPAAEDAARIALHDAVRPYVPALVAGRADLAARTERLLAAEHAEHGSRTFALRLWVPRHRFAQVRDTLGQLPAPVVVVEVRSRDRRGQPPVLLRNMRLFRPFEGLVGFLSWPTPQGLDPTGLMAVVLPLLFGIMVGDVGYGVLLLGIALLVRRRWGQHSAVAGDVSRVLAAGAWWSIVFGVLFGELLGDLGKTLFGMPALWFYRGGPEALMPLLLFVLAVGVAHIVLGLLLGLWLAVQERHLGHALERGGTLLVLIGLFAVAGGALSVLPGELVTPGVAVVVVGVVLASVVHGKLGLLLGPLELVGVLGGILSYLRLAAVGLASVYLAIVANELARQAPLVLGIVIAAFFHALNLALAAFSPMVQALRLHYVEFFGRFYDGGGRLFSPLGAALVDPVPSAVPQPVTGAAAPPAPVRVLVGAR